jgi:hypothetical protein
LAGLLEASPPKKTVSYLSRVHSERVGPFLFLT